MCMLKQKACVITIFQKDNNLCIECRSSSVAAELRILYQWKSVVYTQGTDIVSKSDLFFT